MESLHVELKILAASMAAFAWFGGAWVAFNRLTGGRLRRIEAEDKRLASRVEAWMEDSDAYEIAFRLVLLFIVSVMASTNFACLNGGMGGWLPSSGAWSALVHAGAAATATLAMGAVLAATTRLLVRRFDLLLLRASMPLMWLLRTSLLYPAVEIFTRLDARSDGDTAGASDSETTAEDEILSLLEEEEEAEAEEGAANVLPREERQMIKSVLDLDKTLVREVMTPRVDIVALPASSTVAEAVAAFQRTGHSKLPVYRQCVDEIVGILHARDLLGRAASGGGSIEGLLQKPFYVPETKTVAELLKELRSSHNHLTIVVDEYGGTAGVATLQDLLERIVGEIKSQGDATPPPQIKRHPDGSATVDARTPIGEVNDILGLDIPEDEDYDTIGGYACDLFGRIPQRGEEIVSEGGVALKVLHGDERRILALRVKPPAPAAAAAPGKEAA